MTCAETRPDSLSSFGASARPTGVAPRICISKDSDSSAVCFVMSCEYPVSYTDKSLARFSRSSVICRTDGVLAAMLRRWSVRFRLTQPPRKQPKSQDRTGYQLTPAAKQIRWGDA